MGELEGRFLTGKYSMADDTETKTQARTGLADREDRGATGTHQVPGTNGARQRVEPPYSRAVETTRTGQTEKSSIPAAAPVRKSVPREYFESAVVTFVMALFGMTFIVQAVKVPTGSMKNTIYIGDHLLVNKFLFGPEDGIKVPILPDREIKRGDVIVFKYPRGPETNYVKRVIGLPGDTVEYNPETHRVYINGEELPEHLIKAEYQDSLSPDPLKQIADEGSPPGSWYTVYYQRENDTEFGPHFAVGQPYRVPRKGDPIRDDVEPQYRDVYDADHDGRYDADQYFCMGDNRDNSEDSRYWSTVPRTNVVGRAMFVYWSFSPGDGLASGTRYWRTGKFIK